MFDSTQEIKGGKSYGLKLTVEPRIVGRITLAMRHRADREENVGLRLLSALDGADWRSGASQQSKDVLIPKVRMPCAHERYA